MKLRERIERYVDSCSAAVSGQHGHTTTFLVALTLVRGFDLSLEAALPFLKRYSQRCKPPWSERELAHKLASADTLRPRPGKSVPPRGYLL